MGKKKKGMKLLLAFAVVLLFTIPDTHSDELKDLSSADAPTDTKVAPRKEASLGESEGFSGALMTSGSFTMMAASGMEEEEGELGEGEGFSGALMTSGSFTMMAASGMEE